MWRWIKSKFAWRKVRDTGVKAYWMNTVTGDRMIVTYRTRQVTCHDPTDHDWLKEPPIRPAARPTVGGASRDWWPKLETKSHKPQEELDGDHQHPGHA